MRPLTSIALVVTLTLVSACGDGAQGTSGLGTTSPSEVRTSVTFSGVVPVGGSDVHDFSTSAAGDVSVTLTAASPPPSIFMGLGVGSRNGSSCDYFQNFFEITAPGAAPQITGPLPAGSYCVGVYDTGNATTAVSYTVIVTHL